MITLKCGASSIKKENPHTFIKRGRLMLKFVYRSKYYLINKRKINQRSFYKI